MSLQRVLIPWRAPLALVAGSLFGATGVAAYVAGRTWIADGVFIDPALLIASFIVAWLLWTIGLLAVGVPIWTASHRTGHRSAAWALSCGIATTFICTMLLQLFLAQSYSRLISEGHIVIWEGRRTFYGWFILFKDAVLMANLGGAVATLIHRIAYRRTPKPPPARPS